MRNPTLPISQANLAPTNDIISCKGGHSVQYKAQWKPGEDGRDRPVYSLSPSEHQPFGPEQLSEIFVPWTKLLPDPVIEESVDMLVGFLGGEVVDFGLRSSTYEKYIPQEFRGKAEHVEPCMMSGDDLKSIRPKATSVPKPEGAPQPSTQPQQNPTPRPAVPPPVSSRPIRNFAPDTEQTPPPAPVQAPQQLPPPPQVINIPQPLPESPVQAPAQEAIPSSAGAFADTLKKSPLARLKSLSKRV
jgi:hypothetical protein